MEDILCCNLYFTNFDLLPVQYTKLKPAEEIPTYLGGITLNESWVVYQVYICCK